MQVKLEIVDIYKLPVGQKPQDNRQVTIGDLHGNAMKLMFMLVKEGIAAEVTKEDYINLVRIYLKSVDKLTKKDIEDFNLILDKIKFNTQTAVRLIGDELADRGSNDYFTLKILEKLHTCKVPVEIIISNHSIEFLQACERHSTTKNFKPPMLLGEHANSLKNLNTLVEKGLVGADEVLDIAQRA